MRKDMENQNDIPGNILPEGYLNRGIKSVLEKEGNTPHAKGLIQNFKGFKAFYDHAPNNLKKVVLATTIGAIILSACDRFTPSIDVTSEPIAITQDMYPVDTTKEPIDITQTIGPNPTQETQEPTTQPTIELIPTSTPFPEIKLLENLPNAGGEYSEDQLSVIYSDAFKEKVNVMNDWWSYWGNAEESQRPFHPTSREVHIVPYFDNDNPQSFSTTIQARMDDGDLHTFLLPIDTVNNTFREYPPVEIGTDGIPVEIDYDIPAGLGPLEVTGDISWMEKFGFVKTDVNNIKLTLDFKTGQWVQNEELNKPQIQYETGEALEFSPLLPAVWSKEWIGKVGDLDIPIIIGLSSGVYNDKDTPIKGVWMKQEGVDGLADNFLRAAHYRYTEVMGNVATYEEYLEILKNSERGGEVNLLITENSLNSDRKAVRREALIDPRQGFSLLIANYINPSIGVKYERTNTGFFGVDGKGKLLLASDYFKRSDLDEEILLYGVSVTNFAFISSNTSLIIMFGSIKNECMISGDIYDKCGLPYPPKEANDWRQILNKITADMHLKKQFIPFWGLDR